VFILARASEAKDEVTGEHVARVGDLTAELARAAGLDETSIEAIHDAAMLHDVGKLHIPDRILVKRGTLTPSEWAVMRQHTIWGPEILGRTRGFSLAREIARSHHENWNGSGYPDGLRAERIPVEARMVRITDTFDALRSVRPYKPAWPLERCIDELLGASGSAFDPELLRLFLSIVEQTDTRVVAQPATPEADIGRAAA
jgi:cyclic di-GMP phosphodiesterase